MGGGACEVLPIRKGGGQKVLAMLKGATKSFEVVLTQKLEVLAIVMGGSIKSFQPLKGGRGRTKLYPLLKVGGWGGRKQFQTRNFPIL